MWVEREREVKSTQRSRGCHLLDPNLPAVFINTAGQCPSCGCGFTVKKVIQLGALLLSGTDRLSPTTPPPPPASFSVLGFSAPKLLRNFKGKRAPKLRPTLKWQRFNDLLSLSEGVGILRGTLEE